MISATRLVEVERLIATKIIEDALAKGYLITVNNGGDEDEIYQSNEKEAILENMFSADEDELSFYWVKNTAARIGWVKLVYGNDGYDVINDYLVNDIMTSVLKGAEDLTQQLEKEDKHEESNPKRK